MQESVRVGERVVWESVFRLGVFFWFFSLPVFPLPRPSRSLISPEQGHVTEEGEEGKRGEEEKAYHAAAH